MCLGVYGGGGKGGLRFVFGYEDPDVLLNNAVSVKVQKYREAYAAPDRQVVFLPTILSTSGRINKESLC